MRRIRALVAIVAVVVSATATTVSPMTIERLTQLSEVIVEGTVGSSWAAWDPQHTTIITYSKFRVRSALKGSTAETIMVKQIGGHADGYTVRVAGVRYLQPGEQHVLFLHPSHAADGSFVIAGLNQGDFRVHRTTTEARVSNGVSGAHTYQRVYGVAQEEFAPTGMSLSQLEQRVRQAEAQ